MKRIQHRAIRLHQVGDADAALGVGSNWKKGDLTKLKEHTLVASSRNRLSKEQLQGLKPGETAVTGKGHAEATLVDYVQNNEMAIKDVAASRPVCGPCANKVNAAGGNVVSPLKNPVKQ